MFTKEEIAVIDKIAKKYKIPFVRKNDNLLESVREYVKMPSGVVDLDTLRTKLKFNTTPYLIEKSNNKITCYFKDEKMVYVSYECYSVEELKANLNTLLKG